MAIRKFKSVSAEEVQRLNAENITNTETLLPIFLCLDASYSMQGKRINLLNEGVRKFICNSAHDTNTMDCLRLSIIVFSGAGVQEVQKLTSIKNVTFTPLTPDGGTPMGEAINLALDKISNFLQISRQINQKTYKPYLIVMSDGNAEDRKQLEQAINRARNMQKNRELKVRVVGIGTDEPFTDLSRLTLSGKVESCTDLGVTQFFEWLSTMAIEKSQSSLTDDDDDFDQGQLM